MSIWSTFRCLKDQAQYSYYLLLVHNSLAKNVDRDNSWIMIIDSYLWNKQVIHYIIDNRILNSLSSAESELEIKQKFKTIKSSAWVQLLSALLFVFGSAQPATVRWLCRLHWLSPSSGSAISARAAPAHHKIQLTDVWCRSALLTLIKIWIWIELIFMGTWILEIFSLEIISMFYLLDHVSHKLKHQSCEIDVRWKVLYLDTALLVCFLH